MVLQVERASEITNSFFQGNEEVQFRPQKHGLTMALIEGDILVLVAEAHDEYHARREPPHPVEVYIVEEIKYQPGFKFVIRSTLNKIIQGGKQPVELHKNLLIKPLHPLTVVRKPKGFCTLFELEITHGYRVHYIEYVKHKLPHIYSQLRLG